MNNPELDKKILEELLAESDDEIEILTKRIDNLDFVTPGILQEAKDELVETINTLESDIDSKIESAIDSIIIPEPIPGLDGVSPKIEDIVPEVLKKAIPIIVDKIPVPQKLIKGVDYFDGKPGKDAQPLDPLEVVNSIKKNRSLTIDDIEGFEKSLDALNEKKGIRPITHQFLRGGGDTIKAGSGIIIDVDIDGKKVIRTLGGGTVSEIDTAGLIVGGPITTIGTITTSMNTNKLVGRGSSGMGVMEEITLGTGLSLSGNTLNASAGMAIGGTVTSGTSGSVLFIDGSGDLAQDNANYFWDKTNKRLGIGTNIPSSQVTIYSPTQSLTQTDITGDISKVGLNIVYDYGNNVYTPGIFWSTSNDNPTKPKGGIYLQNTPFGTVMYLGTSSNYSAGSNGQFLVFPSGLIAVPQFAISIGSGGSYGGTGGYNTEMTFYEPTAGGFILNTQYPFSFYDYRQNGTSRLYVASGGNVGIGTTTPGSKLSIIGLPTSAAGLSTGDIWNNAGILTIV